MYCYPRRGYIITSGARSQTVQSAMTRISSDGIRQSFISRQVTVDQALSSERGRAERCQLPVYHGVSFFEPDDDQHDRASNSRKAALRRMVERAVTNEITAAAASHVTRKRKNTYTRTRFHATCPIPGGGIKLA